MDLNTPPPGADRAPELLPAVLRQAIARPPASRPTEALSAMLHGSRSWDTVQTPVSRTVTVASCLTLCLYVIAFFVAIAFEDERGSSQASLHGNTIRSGRCSSLRSARS